MGNCGNIGEHETDSDLSVVDEGPVSRACSLI